MVIEDVIPFLKVFAWLIFCFTMINAVFELTPCDDGFRCEGDNDDYPGLNRFFSIFTDTFRGSVGDISAPKYTEWLDKRDTIWFSTHSFAIYAIWFFWYINIILTLIVMLNFLIAEVGFTFEKVMSLG